ncbi:MAG: NADH-quinone oxidoreductase subunit NuoH [Desulfobulbaceae bacterium]|nr:NADH-quinone oxidoreductase subunit NuoH [Candidatus Kapabacteria bacterium]MBS3999867.1 NADH-quinone oxidoreductase subunit NuoH [Desulfobulbaceae bacterium]
MNDLLWITIEALAKGLAIVMAIQLMAALNVYLERKVSAFIQGRIGPNRVGPWGTLQPFADVAKLFLKEDLVPNAADKFFHSLAPVIALGVALATWAVIPFSSYIQLEDRIIYLGIAPDLNIGILYVLAMTSLGVYGITLAGWSSNNKYSLLGGLRSSAQMISYELSMGLSLVGTVLIVGSFSINDFVDYQQGWGGIRWLIFLQPIGFIIFLIAAFAETNRAPFDLPEAEPELVGGFNTEYSGMKFGMFFLAEYANMTTSSVLIVLLFLGGWSIPFAYEALGLQEGSIMLALVHFLVFFVKVLFMLFFFIWVRWSIPRFRYDQLMNLGWKVLLPLALVNVVVTAAGVLFFK